MNWRPAKTAPRDGTPILGDFGFPWPLYAVFDNYDARWCCATLQACPMEDKRTNYYFENETEPPHRLKRWMPLPKLK